MLPGGVLQKFFPLMYAIDDFLFQLRNLRVEGFESLFSSFSYFDNAMPYSVLLFYEMKCFVYSIIVHSSVDILDDLIDAH